MKKHPIVWSMLLLVLTLASQPSQFAQNTSTGVQEPDMQRRANTVGLVRTINTGEVVEHTTYGSFASWQTLLAHQQEYLNKWLTKFYSQDPSVQFGSGPEILPGWNLRLTVQADGSGWVVLLEDAKDKNGYAALSDERGIIWECKHLQVTAPQQGRLTPGESDGTDRSAVRHSKGRTIFSGESPRAKLSIPRGFRFIGTQQVNLHGNAEAEQYVFARSGRDNIVERFYLIQFEHFLPTNNLTYDYASMRTTQIDNFQFNYDVKSFPNLGALLMEDQGSDGEAMAQLLAKQHLSLPPNTVMVRMFHLPSADHRTELMIIYGEALPQNTPVPVRKGGVQLDTESPDSAQMFLEHARQGLVFRSR